MIRTASRQELPPIRELLARANDAPYDLAAVAEEKCFGDGVAGAPSARVFERDGRIAGVAVTCGKWLRLLAVDRSARRQGIGSALLRDSNASVIAAEPGNYFTPGVWIDDEGSWAFFRARGYVEKQQTWNLAVSWGAAGFSPPVSSGDVKIAAAQETRVLDFIEQEFGRIWRFECSRAEALFFTEEGSEITGFAAIEANNRGLGTFGPTGVAKHMRGRGLGCRLVRAALTALHNRGYERAIIPWTDALDFYRKCCGAEPAHRFVAFARSQP